jgi:phosphatidylglycerophosphate synthase
VTNVQRTFGRAVILADESANWKIAGLRQLERLVLALNECVESNGPESKMDVILFWKPRMPSGEQHFPQIERLSRCNFMIAGQRLPIGPAAIISTRLLVRRRGIAEFLPFAPVFECGLSYVSESALWLRLNEDFQNAYQNALETDMGYHSPPWRCVERNSEVSECERWLLRGSGKKHDGFISRNLNRPVSRAVSRLLLKTQITPNAWTLLILLLPLGACMLLSRGSYPGFVIGAALYQLHSILDGCDGEIARAKYLDSNRGPGVDALGDLAALLLFTLGLGIGLFERAGPSQVRWFFAGEAILSFALIANRLGRHALDLLARGPAAVLSSEHDESLRASGHRLFGPRVTSFLFAITKRDVVFFAFLILAILGLAPWILHLLFLYSLGSAILVRKGRPAGRNDTPGA